TAPLRAESSWHPPAGASEPAETTRAAPAGAGAALVKLSVALSPRRRPGHARRREPGAAAPELRVHRSGPGRGARTQPSTANGARGCWRGTSSAWELPSACLPFLICESPGTCGCAAVSLYGTGRVPGRSAQPFLAATLA